MYELIQISDRDYYIDCPAKIGLVRTGETDAVLIDSGSDKDAGKKVFRILSEKGWTLRAIYNTHSHADHIGGNRFLQEKTGCAIYASGMECVYANTPLLEPIGLYGGLPMEELKHKFLLAQESRVQPLHAEDLPNGMTLLPLPGHCFEMVGFLTPDRTAYIADSVSSEETLAKYGIGYLWNAKESLQTLDYLSTLDAARFVPSHAPMTETIAPLAAVNKASILAMEEKILTLCRVPLSMERLLKAIFDAYGLTMTAQQYVLIGSTLRSTLSVLTEQGRIAYRFCENEMLFQTVGAEG